MTTKTNTTLGELISVLYDEFLALYNDEELASVAVAATINDLLTEAAWRPAVTQPKPPTPPDAGRRPCEQGEDARSPPRRERGC